MRHWRKKERKRIFKEKFCKDLFSRINAFENSAILGKIRENLYSYGVVLVTISILLCYKMLSKKVP